MSETLLKKELAQRTIRPRELGAVACGGCPLAELGCPKKDTGDDCPPSAVIEKVQNATTLLENDAVGSVWATDGGYFSQPSKEAMLQSVRIDVPKIVNAPAKRQPPRPKNPEVKKTRKDPRRGKLMGEFAAALLLPAQKTK